MDHRLERLVFFSDAVFAIAITLLVIEIEVPQLPFGTSNALFWAALAEKKWHFFSFLLSFLVIGRFWVGHHATMGQIHRFDPRIIWPNLMLLMAIAFMPYATALIGTNPGQFIPAVLYNGMMVIIALCHLWLQYRARQAGLFDSPLDANGMPRFIGTFSVVFGALAALLASFFTPALSQLALVTIPFWYRLLAWRYRPKPPAPAQS